MAFLRTVLVSFLLLSAHSAWACPSCALSNNGRFIDQTLLIVGAMWLVPVAIAFAIGFKIYKLCREASEREK